MLPSQAEAGAELSVRSKRGIYNMCWRVDDWCFVWISALLVALRAAKHYLQVEVMAAVVGSTDAWKAIDNLVILELSCLQCRKPVHDFGKIHVHAVMYGKAEDILAVRICDQLLSR